MQPVLRLCILSGLDKMGLVNREKSCESQGRDSQEENDQAGKGAEGRKAGGVNVKQEGSRLIKRNTYATSSAVIG
jgi:hypothetical protein